jgi:hypothetical protein
MTHSFSRTLFVASAIACTLTGLTACSSGPKMVSKDDIAKQITAKMTATSVKGDDVQFDMVETIDKNLVASKLSDQLTEKVGRKPDSVTCPDNLKGNQGATLRCDLKDGGQTYGVTVTVTDVDAGDVHFDFKVDEQPK